MKQFIFHSKPEKPQGGEEPRQPRVTVAAVIEGEEAKFGVSRCSAQDQFTKKKGAQTAIGRAKSRHPYYVTTAPDLGLSRWFVDTAKKLADEAISDARTVERQKIKV